MEVFVTSPWVPPEWIAAHGLEPRGAWFGQTHQPSAVPEGVCAFAQRMADLADAYPEAAVIFTTACDQMRRSADAVCTRANTRAFLFNLPATWQSLAVRRLYHAELARLGRFLESLGGRSPTEADLEKAIADYEARRASVRDLIVRGSPRQAAEGMADYFGGAARRSLRSGDSAERRRLSASKSAALSRAAATSRVPLALVGGPLLPAQWTLFDMIEAVGGSVVLNATEPGERTLLPPFPLTSRSAATPAAAAAMVRQPRDLTERPCCGVAAAGTAARRAVLLETLADHYFEHAVDVFHRPNTRLYDWLRPRLSERQARGIVLWVHVGCDLWRAEAASLREAFALPVLVLDAHEAGTGGLRDANRLAAFIESLHSRAFEDTHERFTEESTGETPSTCCWHPASRIIHGRKNDGSSGETPKAR